MDIPMKKILLSIAVVVSLLFVVIAKSTTTPVKKTSPNRSNEKREQPFRTEKEWHDDVYAWKIFYEHGKDYIYPSKAVITEEYKISKSSFDSILLSVWPKMDRMGFQFSEFLPFFYLVSRTFRNEAKILDFFDEFFGVLTRLSDELGPSYDIDYAKVGVLRFILGRSSIKGLWDRVTYRMIVNYAGSNQAPDNKSACVQRAVEKLTYFQLTIRDAYTEPFK
jgi:hypothetical protein